MSENSRHTQPDWISELATSNPTFKCLSPSGSDYPPTRVHFVAASGGLSFVERVNMHWGFHVNGTHTELPCLGGIGNCPICDLHRKIKLAEGNARRENDTVALETFRLSAFRLRSASYYLYRVVTPDWRIQVLKLRPPHAETVHTLLKSTVEKFGINPISPHDGAWFDLSRAGSGKDTVYHASLATISSDSGAPGAAYDRTAIPSEIILELDGHPIDLRQVFTPTSAQDVLKMIESGHLIGEVQAAVDLLQKFGG